MLSSIRFFRFGALCCAVILLLAARQHVKAEAADDDEEVKSNEAREEETKTERRNYTQVYPLHVSIPAGESVRLSFACIPTLPVDSEALAWAWRRNESTAWLTRLSSRAAMHGTVASEELDVQVRDSLPSFIQLRTISAGGDNTAVGSQSNQLEVVLSVAGSQLHPHEIDAHEATTVAVLMHFVGIVQFIHKSPIRPSVVAEITQRGASSAANAEADTADMNQASPTHRFPPVLVTQSQSALLLVSVSTLQPFTLRAAQMRNLRLSAAQTPNFVRQRVQIQPSAPISIRLSPQIFGPSDDLVFDCSDETGTEIAATVPSTSHLAFACELCAPKESSASSFCAFPAGSFLNVAGGVLTVVSPVSILGSLQINAGSALEFNVSTASVPRLGPFSPISSVIDPRDAQGYSLPIVNEGLLVVRKG
jgi:hypothetical protein